MKILIFIIILNIFAFSQSKIYEKCELARELIWKYNFPMESVANWICLIKAESSFNTTARGVPNTDGSFDHGLFQINDRYWCSAKGIGKVCKINCKYFEDDDIADDIACVKIIYATHGFSAWTGWKNKCQQRLPKIVEECSFI